MSRILIAYASRFGSTERIAAAIAERLTRMGLEVDVLRSAPGIDVSKYDAVVVGSPVYGQHWLPGASLFVAGNAALLAERPLALFSAGMLGVKSPKRALREHDAIVSTLIEVAPGISVASSALFHGAFERKNLPLCLRVLDMIAGTPQGDHRDWGAIDSWADRTGQRFLALLSDEDPPRSRGEVDPPSGGVR